MFIATRIKNILFQPMEEWRVVAGEETKIEELYLHYVMPLAAIGPIATFIGLSIIGMGFLHLSTLSGLIMALMSYLANLVGVFVVAKAIEFLAVTFNCRRNSSQALKLAVYSATPFWVAGILMLFPALGIFALIASLYGIYLLYLGLPLLMQCQQDKAKTYTASIIAAAIAVYLLFAALSNTVVGAPNIEPDTAHLSEADQATMNMLKELAVQAQSAQENSGE